EAAKDPHDPFHVWAVLCDTEDARVLERVAAIDKDREKRSEQWHDDRIHFDTIASCSERWEDIWYFDDVGMTRARIHGGIRWGADPARPILGFRDVEAIERDAFWHGLTQAPGTES